MHIFFVLDLDPQKITFFEENKNVKKWTIWLCFRRVLCVPHKAIYTSHFASLTFGLGYKFMKKKNLCFTVYKWDFWLDEHFCHNDLIHHSNLAGSLVTDYYFSSFFPPKWLCNSFRSLYLSVPLFSLPYSLSLSLPPSTRVEQMEISRTNAELGPVLLSQSYSITPLI